MEVGIMEPKNGYVIALTILTLAPFLFTGNVVELFRGAKEKSRRRYSPYELYLHPRLIWRDTVQMTILIIAAILLLVFLWREVAHGEYHGIRFFNREVSARNGNSHHWNDAGILIGVGISSIIAILVLVHARWMELDQRIEHATKLFLLILLTTIKSWSSHWLLAFVVVPLVVLILVLFYSDHKKYVELQRLERLRKDREERKIEQVRRDEAIAREAARLRKNAQNRASYHRRKGSSVLKSEDSLKSASHLSERDPSSLE